MNEKPHTHEITISSYYSDGTGAMYVRYGDQKKRVIKRLPMLQARLRRVSRRIIARHDRESQKAPFTPLNTAKAIVADLNTQLVTSNPVYPYVITSRQVWGTEALKEKVDASTG